MSDKTSSAATSGPGRPRGWREALQEQTFTLAILRVSAERLSQLTDRAEVVQALDEILANVLGTERWVLYELAPGGAELRPVAGRGGAETHAAPLSIKGSHLGRLAAQQSVTLADAAAGPGAPAALVPLVHGGQLCGAIEIVEFLHHKSGRAAHDEEVLRLLMSVGGKALRLSVAR